MNLLELLLQFIQSIFNGNYSGPEQIPDKIKHDLDPQVLKDSEVKMDDQVNWNDLESPLGRHFKVKDAIWLPSWNRAANEADGLTEEIKSNLILTFQKLDMIRDYLGKPINVHVAFRPTEYNALVKGAKSSAHLFGKAVDWDANLGLGSAGENCDKIREMLEPCLDEWNLRMEDNGPQSPWVHIDTAEVISKRYFKP